MESLHSQLGSERNRLTTLIALDQQVQSDDVIVKVSFEFFGSMTCMTVTRSEGPTAMSVPGIVCALAFEPPSITPSMARVASSRRAPRSSCFPLDGSICLSFPLRRKVLVA